MIRRPTPSEKPGPIPRPEFEPDLLIVKFKSDVVSTPPRVRVFSKRGMIENAILPTNLFSPFETLMQEETLQSIKPLFGPDPAPKKTKATVRNFASMVASSIVGAAEDDDFSGINILRFDPSTDLKKLEAKVNRMPGISYCHRLPKRWLAARRAAPTVSDPMINRQWALRAIEWFAAGSLPDASGVKVAVLDSGFDTTHPDLPTPSIYDHRGSSTKDLIGHGTHVAGVIAAKTNNNVGIAGVSNSNLNIWKIFRDESDSEDPTDYSVDNELYHRALKDSLTAGVHVMNLSIGGPYSTATEEMLFRHILAAGVTVVAAMGNGYQVGNDMEYPGAHDGVLAIAAVDETNRRAKFSSTGRHVALAAPGVNILSTLPLKRSDCRPQEVEYASWDGTSMATPHVAAAAALIRAKYPNMTPDEVIKKLKSKVNKLADPKIQVGTGLLSVKKVLS